MYDEELTRQERREYIVGENPVTREDTLSITDALDLAAEANELVFAVGDPEAMGLTDILRKLARALVASRMRELGL